MSSAIITNLSNPIRAKLILEIYARGSLTAKQLLDKFPDITQPTMYRHIKAMLDDGTLKVVNETPIRGTVEKSYAVTTDLQEDAKRIVTENDGTGYLELFTRYIMGITAEFKNYTEREGINILKDGSGFTIAPVYATAAELHDALLKIGEIIQGLYKNEQAEGRELHNICLITTPPKK